VGQAAEANALIERAFAEIAEGIASTRSAFEEILAGMKDLQDGTRDINASSTEVVHCSADITSSIRAMDGIIAKNGEVIETVMRKTTASLKELARVSAGTGDVIERSRNVRELGEKADRVMCELDSAIAALNG